MAFMAYLKLSGERQGEINGPVTLFGRENSIEVGGWQHEVNVPRSPGSGMATGRRQHGPLVIVKGLDKTSPQLMSALIASERFASWRLECWQSSIEEDGTQQAYYRIELNDAFITGIATEQSGDSQPEDGAAEVRERVTFAYTRITWTWLDGGITAEDDLARLV
jgi:type VI secretion system secreted protein Hcp